jgi:hypothetical protein
MKSYHLKQTWLQKFACSHLSITPVRHLPMMKASPPPKEEENDDDDNHPVKKYFVLDHIHFHTFSL